MGKRKSVYSESEKAYNLALSMSLADAARGVNRRELAERLGVSERSVMKWLRLDGSVPSIVNLAKLCRVLDLDANKLLGVER